MRKQSFKEREGGMLCSTLPVSGNSCSVAAILCFFDAPSLECLGVNAR